MRSIRAKDGPIMHHKTAPRGTLAGYTFGTPNDKNCTCSDSDGRTVVKFGAGAGADDSSIRAVRQLLVRKAYWHRRLFSRAIQGEKNSQRFQTAYIVQAGSER